MRFGICSPPDRAAAMAEAGFDFVEWPMSRTVGEMDEDAFGSLTTFTRDLPISPEAWNVMLPASIKVVGPDADLAEASRYLETALSRAAELEGKVVVFGSGGARTIPDDWSRDEAMRQFDDACQLVGDVARRHRIAIAIEPLNRSETNIVNTVAEDAEVVGRVNHSSVKLLSDLYHVVEEDEPLTDTGAAASMLAHVHVAEPHLRTMPRANEMDSVYHDYFSILRRSGYNQRISIECSTPTVEEAAEGLQYLRHVWDNTSAAVPS